MRRFVRRRGDEENPAWPGLVDVFAFGMVAVMLLSAIMTSTRGGKDPPPPPPSGVDLKEITYMELQLVYERLQQQGIEAGLNKDPWPYIKIALFKGKPVYFESGKYDFTSEDRDDVFQFADALAPVVPSQSMAEIFISGTADPQSLEQREAPRDNVDLSALRAATVAAVLRDAGIPAKKIFVQGLGEIGKSEISAAPSREDIEAYKLYVESLKKYRQVYLELRVDMSKVRIPITQRK